VSTCNPVQDWQCCNNGRTQYSARRDAIEERNRLKKWAEHAILVVCPDELPGSEASQTSRPTSTT
jgi:hypothetical protein